MQGRGGGRLAGIRDADLEVTPGVRFMVVDRQWADRYH